MLKPEKSFDIDEKLIPANMFILTTSILNCLDIETTDLVAGTGLTANELEDPYALISFRQCCSVISNALQISRNPALGLYLAEKGGFAAWGVLGSALASCESVLDSTHVAIQLFQPTWLIPSLEEGPEVTTLQINTAHAVGNILPCIMEEAFGGMVWLVKTVFNHAITPKQLQLTYRPPAHADRYRSFFQCQVLFNQPANRIIWETAQIKMPNPSYHPASKKIAIDLCQQILDRQKVPQSLLYTIRSMLIRQIEDSPSMAEVASDLGMTERTLRRKLNDSGTSFQSIVDDIRKNIAIEQLQTTDMPIKDIAYFIGMRDAGNFSRNFKKWTGKTAGYFRR